LACESGEKGIHWKRLVCWDREEKEKRSGDLTNLGKKPSTGHPRPERAENL